MFSQRAYADATRESGKAIERLATGKQINRASDDPAGIMMVEGLKASAYVQKVASRPNADTALARLKSAAQGL